MAEITGINSKELTVLKFRILELKQHIRMKFRHQLFVSLRVHEFNKFYEEFFYTKSPGSTPEVINNSFSRVFLKLNKF